MKKLLCILLIAVISLPMFTACKDEEKNNEITPMGRYVEEEIEMPEEVVGAPSEGVYYKDGKLYYSGFNWDTAHENREFFLYSMVSDGVWQKETLPECVNANLEDGKISYYIASNGDVYMVYPFGKIKVMRNGSEQLEELNLEMPEDYEGYYRRIRVLDDGTMLVIGAYEIVVFNDGEKQPAGVINANTGNGFEIINDNSVIAFSDSKDCYLKYSLNTFLPLSQDPVVPEELTPRMQSVLYTSQNSKGDLFVLGPKGLSVKQNGTETWETLIDPDMTCIGLMIYLDNMAVSDDGEVYIYADMARNGSDGQIFRYRYDAGAEVPTDRKTLTIHAPMLSNDIKTMTALFQKEHPELLVELKTDDDLIKVGGLSAVYNDGVKRLNTELIAGKGPDVLMFDNVDPNIYIEKGALLEISDTIDPILREGDYFDAMVNSLKTEKGLYAVVASYSTRFTAASDELAPFTGSTALLAEFAQKNPDKYVFSPAVYSVSAWQLLRQLYPIYEKELYDENGRITKDRIQGFIENVKILYDQLGSYKGPTPYDTYDDWSDEYVVLGGDLTGFVRMRDEGECNYIIDIPWESKFGSCSGIAEARKTAGFKVEGTKGFSIGTAAGINVNTKCPDEAKEFVAFMLSDTVQNRFGEVSEPVSRKIETKRINSWIGKDPLMRFTDYRNIDRENIKFIDLKMDSMTEEDAAWLLSELDKTTKLVSQENDFFDEVQITLKEETGDYFSGKCSSEEAAERIYSKIQLKING